MERRWALALAVLWAAACSKEPEGDPFSLGGTAPIQMGDDEDEDEDEDEDGAGSSTGEPGGDGSSSTGPPDADESSSGGDPPPVTTDPGTTGDPPGNGNQPPTGQYSHCLEANQCVGTNMCLQVQQNMTIIDGFCTDYPCADPTTDCTPAPGGTATPSCYPINVGGMDSTACALDCSGGKTCPGGMECLPLSMGTVCA